MTVKIIEIIIKGILFVLLLCEAYGDIDKKQVNMMPVVISVALMTPLRIAACIMSGEVSDYIMGILLCVIMLGLSLITKEAMGLGDIVLIGTVSIFAGFDFGLKTLMIALVGAAVYGILLMTRMRSKKNETMPFVPFLAGSYTIELSLLMPIILLVILLIVYLTIYNHDKAVIEHACYISLRRAIDDDELSSKICEEIFDEEVKGGIVGKWNINREANYDESTSIVSIKATSKMHLREGIAIRNLGTGLFSYTTEYSLSAVNPEDYVRRNAISY